jgi:hypothetical protein
MVLKINGLTKSEIEQLRSEYGLLSLQCATGKWTKEKEKRRDYLYSLLVKIHNHQDYWKMFKEGEHYYFP